MPLTVSTHTFRLGVGVADGAAQQGEGGIIEILECVHAHRDVGELDGEGLPVVGRFLRRRGDRLDVLEGLHRLRPLRLGGTAVSGRELGVRLRDEGLDRRRLRMCFQAVDQHDRSDAGGGERPLLHHVGLGAARGGADLGLRRAIALGRTGRRLRRAAGFRFDGRSARHRGHRRLGPEPEGMEKSHGELRREREGKSSRQSRNVQPSSKRWAHPAATSSG